MGYIALLLTTTDRTVCPKAVECKREFASILGKRLSLESRVHEQVHWSNLGEHVRT